MIKTNWKNVKPTIAHEAGIDWQLLKGQSLRDINNPFACMKGMMYVARALLQPGLSYHPHAHDDHEEVYYIIKGKGQIRIDDDEDDIEEGDIVYIGPNQIHEIKNTGQEMIEFLAFAAEVHGGDTQKCE